MPQRLVGHHWTEIGAADADVDDVADGPPGVPAPAAVAHLVAEGRHAVEDGVHLRYYVYSIDQHLLVLWSPQSNVERGPLLGHVDLLAAEHGINAPGQAAFLGQPEQRNECRIGDAPGSSVALFDAMQSSRSCHDLSKDAVPSRWSWVASAASSTPIRLKAASVSSASPPSTGITPRSCPRSAKASKVLSGIVLMVSGAASVSMYSVSEAAGSLVPVLAQSRRCVRAPAAASRRHRGDASRPRYALYVRLATAIPRRLRSSWGTTPLTATSQRLTNNDATESTRGSKPAASLRSIPRM